MSDISNIESELNQASTSAEGSFVVGKIIDHLADVETINKQKNVKSIIEDNLRRAARKESAIRSSTVSFAKSPTLPEDTIIKAFNTVWIIDRHRPDVTIWSDSSNVYVQFISQEEKFIFIGWLKDSLDAILIKRSILPVNNLGLHFQRKPVCLVLSRVLNSIKTDRINRTLGHIMTLDCKLTKGKDGVEHVPSKRRSITFLANSNAFRKIFLELNGCVPYLNGTAKFRAQLTFRINCRPMTCKTCHRIGKHTCKGRVCLKCAKSGHGSSNCSSKFKACINCQRKGHNSRDSTCPVFIWAVTRELFKSDIPLEFYENAGLRDQLIQALLLK